MLLPRLTLDNRCMQAYDAPTSHGRRSLKHGSENVLIRRLALCLPLVLIGSAPMATETGTATSVKVPVDDARTKSINSVLYEPLGSGPFPAVIILAGFDAVTGRWEVPSYSIERTRNGGTPLRAAHLER